MYLSKTSILAGLNCAKHLYLMLKHPELAIAKESPLAEAGIAVGKKAREEFSNGVLVNRFQRDEDAFAESRKFLDDESTAAIFEAGFRFQDTEVFVDILQR